MIRIQEQWHNEQNEICLPCIQLVHHSNYLMAVETNEHMLPYYL